MRLWEVDTAYCRETWALGGVVKRSVDNREVERVEAVTSIAWNPNPSHHVLACTVGNRIVFIATGTGDEDGREITHTLLSNVPAADAPAPEEEDEEEGEDGAKESRRKPQISWTIPDTVGKSALSGSGVRLVLQFPTPVLQVAWHSKGNDCYVMHVSFFTMCVCCSIGDYIASLCTADNKAVSEAKSIAVHQVTLHGCSGVYSVDSLCVL